jgi:hypothetical protein
MPAATGAFAVVVAVALLQWFGIRSAITSPPEPVGWLASAADGRAAFAGLPPLAAIERGHISTCATDCPGNLASDPSGEVDPSGGSIPRESSPLGTSALGYVSGPYVVLQLLGVTGAPRGVVSVGAAGRRTTGYSPGLRTGVTRTLLLSARAMNRGAAAS